MEKEKLVPLIKAAQRKGANAQRELYLDSYQNVYYLALKMLQDENAAEDIVQDTYITALYLSNIHLAAGNPGILGLGGIRTKLLAVQFRRYNQQKSDKEKTMNENKQWLCFILVALFTFLVGCNGESRSSFSAESDSSTSVPLVGMSTIQQASSSSEMLGENVPVDTKEIWGSGVYVMGYTVDLQFPDFSYTLKVVLAENGDDYFFQSEGDIPFMGYLKSRVIVKDGIGYSVDDTNETYSMEIDDYGVYEDASTSFSDLGELLGTGEEEFNGFVYYYEEYEMDTGPMRFYFNGTELVGMKGIATTLDATLQDIMTGEMIITVEYISPVAPADLFEVPAGYQLLQ